MGYVVVTLGGVQRCDLVDRKIFVGVREGVGVWFEDDLRQSR